MPDETSGEAPALLAQQPVVGDGNPAINPPLEIPADILGRIKPVSINRDELCRIAQIDRTIVRLLQIRKAEMSEPLPTREQQRQQMQRAKRELAEFHRLKTLREKRTATARMLEAQILQRLLTIQEREEGKIVHQIERKLGVCFRTGKITK